MKEAVTVERSARPTMISAKYRLKEERRRMLKLSVSKLRRIEDPESALRRSVLINNTVRRLQREQREARNPAPVSAVSAVTEAMFADAAVTPLRDEEPAVITTVAPEAATPSQVLEELEDVLSQFYMPPTPRMITSIDEDEARDDEACKRSASSSPPRAACPSASACPSPAKRPRLVDRLVDRLDADDEARALADPTNTLEDFKDEVYLRSKPRVPLASAPCANACEDALRADYCSRRYSQCGTHTGHDRENIAPYFGGLMAADDSLAAGLAGGAAAGLGAGVSLQLQHSLQGLQGLQPYSCSQAHGQAQATLQSGMQHGVHGLAFHGLMATMES